jgi:hypothetical protein
MNGSDFDALDDQIESSSPSDNSSGYEEYPWINVTPRIAIAGTIRALGSTCDLDNEQNIRGANGRGGDTILTLEDPEVLLGDVFEATDRSSAGEAIRTDDSNGEFVDYRVVDFDDKVIGKKIEETAEGDFDRVGITYYDNPYYSEERDGFRENETVELFVSSHAGQLVFQALHAGEISAYYPDGATELADHNGGAVEFPDNYNEEDYTPDSDGYPRIANAGELHPELEGERIVFYLKWGDETQGNRKHIGHVLWDRGEDEITEMTNLVNEDPLDPADVAKDTYANLVWDSPDDFDGSDGDTDGSGATADSGDGNDTAFDALDDQIEDTTGGSVDPTSYADLGPEEQGFVDKAVELAERNGASPTDVVGGEDAFVAAWEDEDLEGTVDGQSALQIAETRYQGLTA